MGVHGLWQLLQSTGKPVSLESLEGKTLAVDVSIWLHQVTKGLRDKDGNPVANAHLQGLFSRVCKLLYYRVKPVFVFDGGVPLLKKQTIAHRWEMKDLAKEEANKTSKKLLHNLMHSHAVKQVLGTATSGAQPVQRTHDMFELPPLPEPDRELTHSLNYEEEQLSEDVSRYHQIIEAEFQCLEDVDLESEDFQSLPSEIKHEILSEMKEMRKQRWTNASEFPQEAGDFSSYQMAKIVKQSKLTSRLTAVRKEMNSRTSVDVCNEFGEQFSASEIHTQRVVSDDTSHYILLQGVDRIKQLEEASKCQVITRENVEMSVSENKAYSSAARDDLQLHNTDLATKTDGHNVNEQTNLKTVACSESDIVLQKTFKNLLYKQYNYEDISATASKTKSVHCETVDSKAVHCEAVDSKAVDCETVDSKAVDCETVDSKAVDCETVDSKAVDCETVDSKAVDCETVDSKAVDCETVDSKAVDCETVDSKAVDCETVDSKAVDCETVDSKAVDCETVDSKAVHCETVDSKAVHCETVDSKAVDCETVDSKAVDCETVDSKAVHCETVDSKAVHCETVDSKAVHCETVDSKAVHCETVDSKAVHCETVDSKAVRCETVDSKAVRCETVYSKAVHCETVDSKAVHCETVYSKAVHCETVDSKAVDCETVDSKAVHTKTVELSVKETCGITDELFIESSADEADDQTKGGGHFSIAGDSGVKNTEKTVLAGIQDNVTQVPHTKPPNTTPNRLHQLDRDKVSVEIHKNVVLNDERLLNQLDGDMVTNSSDDCDNLDTLHPNGREEITVLSSSPSSCDSDDENFIEVADDPSPLKADAMVTAAMFEPVDKMATNRSCVFSDDTSDADMEMMNNTSENSPLSRFEPPSTVITAAEQSEGGEGAEHIRAPITRTDLEDMRDKLEVESGSLRAERGRQERLATSITDQMNSDAQELLQLFGIPYVVSPMEAEAQCAQLNSANMADGIITDDSDVWLFGGQQVYKNFFKQNKHVELYTSAKIQTQLGMTRERLINIAYLCGSDYTVGVAGVGPVTALEILAEFPGDCISGLVDLKKWWEESGRVKKQAPTSKIKSKLRDLNIEPGFPNPSVAEAYLSPAVDLSTETFTWGVPDLDLLRKFASEKMGWSQQKTDSFILPVMKQLNDKQNQTKISSYFQPENFVEVPRISSLRMKRALNKINHSTDVKQAETNESRVKKAKVILAESRKRQSKRGDHGKRGKTRGRGEVRTERTVGNEVFLSDCSSSGEETGSGPVAEDKALDAHKQFSSSGGFFPDMDESSEGESSRKQVVSGKEGKGKGRGKNRKDVKRSQKHSGAACI